MTSSKELHLQVLSEVERDLESLYSQIPTTLLMQIKSLESVAKYHQAKLGGVDAVVNLVSEKQPAIVPPNNGSLAGMRQIEAAEKVLRAASSTMKTAEIADAMVKRGFETDDLKKLKMTLFTSLLRKSDVFEKAGVGSWKIKQ